MVVGSSAFCDCGVGDDACAVSADLVDCFAAYFWRFWIFEAEGLRTVYLEVMRVCGLVLGQVACGAGHVTYGGWPGLEQQ